MKLTYDGDFGAAPEQFGGEVGFGVPDLRALAMPDRGTSLLGTMAGHANAPGIFAGEATWRAETLRSAALEWDSYAGDGRNFKANPWLGETALPAPGQPHPAK